MEEEPRRQNRYMGQVFQLEETENIRYGAEMSPKKNKEVGSCTALKGMVKISPRMTIVHLNSFTEEKDLRLQSPYTILAALWRAETRARET